MAAINYPYAYELMLEAKNIVAEQNPVLTQFMLTEDTKCGGLVLDGHRILYDPVQVENISFNGLIEAVGTLVVHIVLVNKDICSLTIDPSTTLQ